MRKSPEFDLVPLRHMLDAANAAQRFVACRSRNALQSDVSLTYALSMAVEIVGAAAAQISDELQAAYPKINWAKLTSMRHHLAHEYYEVNYDDLWDLAVNDIPPLITELELILARIDGA